VHLALAMTQEQEGNKQRAHDLAALSGSPSPKKITSQEPAGRVAGVEKSLWSSPKKRTGVLYFQGS